MRPHHVLLLIAALAACERPAGPDRPWEDRLAEARTPDARVQLLIATAEPLWAGSPDSATALLLLADAEPRNQLSRPALRALIAARSTWVRRTKDSSAVRYGHAFLDGVDAGDTLIRALALRMLAQAYGVRGLERPADSLLALAIDLAEASADSAAIVDSYADRMRTATAIGRPDLSLELSRWITRPYLTTPDSSARCTFLVNRANAFAQLAKLDSALADLEEARDISAAIGDSTVLASSCAMLGAYQNYTGQVVDAATNLHEAYRVAEAQGNPQLIAASAFNLALVYKQLKQYPAAYPLVLRAWQVADSIGMHDLAAIAHGARAVLWGEADSAQALVFGLPERRRYDTALVVLRDALRKVEALGNLQWVGIFEATIGEVLVSKHLPDEAEPHAVRAQEVTAAIGDQHMLAIAEHTLADIAFERRQWKQALGHYERALGIDRALGMKENAVHVLDRKSRVLEQLGRTTEALADGREAMELQKSYLNEGNMIAVARFEEQAAAARQQLADSLRARQRLLAERDQRTIAELSASRNRTAAWGVGGFAVLALGGGAFAWRTERRRKDAETASALARANERTAEEKRKAAEFQNAALRAQMDEHFISNTLNAVNAHLYTDDPDAASTLLQRFAQWIRTMLETSQHATIPLKDDLEALRTYLELQRSRLDGRFDFAVEVDPAIDTARVNVPPLVVQPLLENAIEHGVGPLKEGGRITLSAGLRNGSLLLSVEDNGVGRGPADEQPERSHRKTSLSTRIIRDQLELLRQRTGRAAELRTIDLPRGTRVEVLLPV